MKTNKLKEKIYICNIDFPNLELEKGNYFPTYRFTKEAIENAIKKGAIIEETLSQKTMKTNKLKEKKEIVEIHIYVHQQGNSNGCGGGTYYPQEQRCTCYDQTSTGDCPVHGKIIKLNFK